MGGGNRQETLALGDTPNIAARLQGLAAANTVVVSAATLGLIEGFFTCQVLGAHALKGVEEPLRVYQLLAESGAQTRLDAVAPRGLTPMVGREQELGLLLERWTQSTEGHGQVVLLSGEAGIGKSRLIEVLRERVGREGATWLTFRCSPYHTNSALYPVITHLQRMLQFRPEETPAEQLERLEHALQSTRLPLEEVVPLLAALLSVPLAERYAPLDWSPQKQQQKTQEALVAWLVAEAERQPVLAVWEDLHWADPSTLEWLGLVLDQTPTVPLCTLLTYRPEFPPPWAPRSYLTQLTLSRLTRPQVEEMLQRITGGKRLPVEVVRQMVAKTDGVPLFVEELTKTVLASGLLEEQEDRYALPGPLPPLAIPATLHDALLARLDRLAAAKVVAQLGATIGRTFTYDVVQAVASLDAASLQRALAQLVEAEVVVHRGLPPQATYTFKHALIQDVAYESLLRSTRQQQHQRIAQVLVEHFPETAGVQPEVVAQHYTAAGLHAQALSYWQLAGQHALDRSAYRIGFFGVRFRVIKTSARRSVILRSKAFCPGQGVDEWYEHEFWSNDGQRVCHHGGSLSDTTQGFCGWCSPGGEAYTKAYHTTSGRAYGHYNLHPDGQTMITDGEARPGCISKVHLRDGKQIFDVICRHDSYTYGDDQRCHPHPSFTPDGRHLLTWGFDNTLTIWEPETGEPVSGESSARRP
jgi:hypothetical protein